MHAHGTTHLTALHRQSYLPNSLAELCNTVVADGLKKIVHFYLVREMLQQLNGLPK